MIIRQTPNNPAILVKSSYIWILPWFSSFKAIVTMVNKNANWKKNNRCKYSTFSLDKADIVNAIAVTPDAIAATQYSIKNNTELPVFYDIPTRAFIYWDLS